MNYPHLSRNERIAITYLRGQGFSIRATARQLNRSASTISRELRRNRCRDDDVYVPVIAHQQAVGRRSSSRTNMRLKASDFVCVCHLLKMKWSPQQIHGYLQRMGFKVPSHETIYRYVWKDKDQGGSLWKHLRQSPKKRRKRYGAYDSRGRVSAKRDIEDRPKEIESRLTQGHWEIDTVMGKGSKHCIMTLVERKTGYVEIGLLNDKSTEQMNQRLIKTLRKAPSLYQTITADNGTEFNQYQKVEKALKHLKFYFAKPYHSWQRGTNENTNGLIRQYLPKGKSMENLTQKDCDEIADQLNMRPRKRLGYKAPIEVMKI